ncbi:RNA-binding protein NOB1 [Prorops nasuta]|uniref:RNA-binding protein NOB1 n=1 Tax=Prorops nasuta TaxID=863751 RepID=UPI0034CE0EF0
MATLSKKIQYLIVDTSAFIRNASLQDIGVNIITEQGVVEEIKNKRQLRRLIVLPYELKVQDAFADNIKFVTEFAKKTGDYRSLSANDIKVIALTYQLEKEKVGCDHLKKTPVIPKTVDSSAPHPEDHPKPLVGFYIPEKKDYKQTELEILENKCNNINEVEVNTDISVVSDDDDEPSFGTVKIENDEEVKNASNLAEKFANLTCNLMELKVENEAGRKHDVDDVLIPIKDWHNNDNFNSDEDENEGQNSEDSDDDDDDVGWITPGNISAIKKQMDAEILEEKPAIVACMTTDFAMQNVLMQMGLNVASLDGRVIKQMRSFIFRCYACFKTTSIMTKVFCPHCGLRTLKKVAVSVDDNGEQRIHINYRKPLTARGKKFSLPTPKGGKHANNPILCEDQPIPHQKPSRLARTKNDPLQEDYIAGYSPFITRDINSKSAMLGIRPGNTIKYWMRRNPNESRRKRK